MQIFFRSLRGSWRIPVLVATAASLGFIGCAERSAGRDPEADAGATADASSLPDASNVRADGSSVCVHGPEDSYAACSDGCSNDDDAFIDCDDRDCCSVVSGCPAGTYCGRDDCSPGPEDTAAACSDSCSNDDDAFIDCDDRDCCSVVSGCPASSYCGASAAGESTPAQCQNGVDDDVNGAADCEDVGCCDVVACASGSGCNPNWCLDGIVELTVSSPTEPTRTEVHNGKTTGAAGPLWLEVAGLDITWNPERDIPYTRACHATGQFIRRYDCSVTVTSQRWHTDEGCGALRGSMTMLAQDGSGRHFLVRFAIATAKTEMQVDFAEP